MKVALAHDHLNQIGGAERVVLAMHQIWEDAPLYTIVRDKTKIGDFFNGLQIKTSFIQHLPFSLSKLRWYLFLMPKAVERFDFSGYDVVVSSASAFAKGIIVPKKTLHFCYCHTPTRYLWSEADNYIKEIGGGIIINKIWPHVLNYLREWDYNAAKRVDYFIANSRCVADRIKLYYNRESKVIYPPVSVNGYPKEKKENFFVIVSRLRPYKKIDLAIQAFNRLRIKLVIVGDGEDRARLEKMSGDNIFFTGNLCEKEKKKILAQALGFVHPQEEDAGISAVEAMAAGTPVIAYGAGGALETVVDKKTGLFFEEQTWQSLADAVIRFRKLNFDYDKIRNHAQKFSKERFMEEMKNFVEEKYSNVGT